MWLIANKNNVNIGLNTVLPIWKRQEYELCMNFIILSFFCKYSAILNKFIMAGVV